LEENRALVQNYLQGKRRQGLAASSITEITDTPDEKTPDGIIARRAIEELRKFKETGEPFFLAAGFYRPHMPLTAPKKYWDMYDRAEIKLPADFRQPDDGIPRYDWDEVRRYGDCPWKGPMPEEKAKEIIHGYHASISFVDAQVGKVLDELCRLGLDKNTVVVLWSDNGWSLAEHGRFSKFTDYETSTHITLMFRVPWLPSQPATPALVELVDVYPTLADLCRLPAPGYLEGTSLVPLLADPKRPWKSAVFSCLFGTKSRTLRTDRYRLIEHPDGQIELYDHRTDPAEDHNLAKDPALAGTLRELQAALDTGWRAARPARSD
jgi:arylsulfatase A-like enzyme